MREYTIKHKRYTKYTRKSGYTKIPESARIRHNLLNFTFSSFLFHRSNHLRCSVKKVFLEISQNSQENTCARVPFFIKKRDSGKGVFLWIFRIFQEHLFYRTPPDGCFWKKFLFWNYVLLLGTYCQVLRNWGGVLHSTLWKFILNYVYFFKLIWKFSKFWHSDQSSGRNSFAPLWLNLKHVRIMDLVPLLFWETLSGVQLLTWKVKLW